MRYSVIRVNVDHCQSLGLLLLYVFFFYYVGQIVKAMLGVICVSYDHEHILYMFDLKKQYRGEKFIRIYKTLRI